MNPGSTFVSRIWERTNTLNPINLCNMKCTGGGVSGHRSEYQSSASYIIYYYEVKLEPSHIKETKSNNLPRSRNEAHF